ncbi:hypothetical protein BLNAU_13317 [Blattamonas nauphoetae]|uniref:Uncharacterized protein n=1 Tax=Blattamonas nauphoetae TaxID=2049346 RepID=A0ABQ9XKH1_9EUKA|nr:hypothetical protein BLNAU_13317 [Blattamonas nauphoetae]
MRNSSPTPIVFLPPPENQKEDQKLHSIPHPTHIQPNTGEHLDRPSLNTASIDIPHEQPQLSVATTNSFESQSILSKPKARKPSDLFSSQKSISSTKQPFPYRRTARQEGSNKPWEVKNKQPVKFGQRPQQTIQQRPAQHTSELKLKQEENEHLLQSVSDLKTKLAQEKVKAKVLQEDIESKENDIDELVETKHKLNLLAQRNAQLEFSLKEAEERFQTSCLISTGEFDIQKRISLPEYASEGYLLLPANIRENLAMVEEDNIRLLNLRRKQNLLIEDLQTELHQEKITKQQYVSLMDEMGKQYSSLAAKCNVQIEENANLHVQLAAISADVQKLEQEKQAMETKLVEKHLEYEKLYESRSQGEENSNEMLRQRVQVLVHDVSEEKRKREEFRLEKEQFQGELVSAVANLQKEKDSIQLLCKALTTLADQCQAEGDEHGVRGLSLINKDVDDEKNGDDDISINSEDEQLLANDLTIFSADAFQLEGITEMEEQKLRVLFGEEYDLIVDGMNRLEFGYKSIPLDSISLTASFPQLLSIISCTLSLVTKITLLEDELATQKDQQQETYDEVKARMELLEEQCLTLESEKQDLIQQVDELTEFTKDGAGHLKMQNQDLVESNKELTLKLNSKAKIVERKEAENARIRDDLAERERELLTMTEENKQLRDQLETVQKTYQSIQHQLQAQVESNSEDQVSIQLLRQVEQGKREKEDEFKRKETEFETRENELKAKIVLLEQELADVTEVAAKRGFEHQTAPSFDRKVPRKLVPKHDKSAFFGLAPHSPLPQSTDIPILLDRMTTAVSSTLSQHDYETIKNIHHDLSSLFIILFSALPNKHVLSSSHRSHPSLTAYDIPRRMNNIFSSLQTMAVSSPAPVSGLPLCTMLALSCMFISAIKHQPILDSIPSFIPSQFEILVGHGIFEELGKLLELCDVSIEEAPIKIAKSFMDIVSGVVDEWNWVLIGFIVTQFSLVIIEVEKGRAQQRVQSKSSQSDDTLQPLPWSVSVSNLNTPPIVGSTLTLISKGLDHFLAEQPSHSETTSFNASSSLSDTVRCYIGATILDAVSFSPSFVASDASNCVVSMINSMSFIDFTPILDHSLSFIVRIFRSSLADTVKQQFLNCDGISKLMEILGTLSDFDSDTFESVLHSVSSSSTQLFWTSHRTLNQQMQIALNALTIFTTTVQPRSLGAIFDKGIHCVPLNLIKSAIEVSSSPPMIETSTKESSHSIFISLLGVCLQALSSIVRHPASLHSLLFTHYLIPIIFSIRQIHTHKSLRDKVLSLTNIILSSTIRDDHTQMPLSTLAALSLLNSRPSLESLMGVILKSQPHSTGFNNALHILMRILSIRVAASVEMNSSSKDVKSKRIPSRSETPTETPDLSSDIVHFELPSIIQKLFWALGQCSDCLEGNATHDEFSERVVLSSIENALRCVSLLVCPSSIGTIQFPAPFILKDMSDSQLKRLSDRYAIIPSISANDLMARNYPSERYESTESSETASTVTSHTEEDETSLVLPEISTQRFIQIIFDLFAILLEKYYDSGRGHRGDDDAEDEIQKLSLVSKSLSAIINTISHMCMIIPSSTTKQSFLSEFAQYSILSSTTLAQITPNSKAPPSFSRDFRRVNMFSHLPLIQQNQSQVIVDSLFSIISASMKRGDALVTQAGLTLLSRFIISPTSKQSPPTFDQFIVSFLSSSSLSILFSILHSQTLVHPLTLTHDTTQNQEKINQARIESLPLINAHMALSLLITISRLLLRTLVDKQDGSKLSAMTALQLLSMIHKEFILYLSKRSKSTDLPCFCDSGKHDETTKLKLHHFNCSNSTTTLICPITLHTAITSMIVERLFRLKEMPLLFSSVFADDFTNTSIVAALQNEQNEIPLHEPVQKYFEVDSLSLRLFLNALQSLPPSSTESFQLLTLLQLLFSTNSQSLRAATKSHFFSTGFISLLKATIEEGLIDNARILLQVVHTLSKNEKLFSLVVIEENQKILETKSVMNESTSTLLETLLLVFSKFSRTIAHLMKQIIQNGSSKKNTDHIETLQDVVTSLKTTISVLISLLRTKQQRQLALSVTLMNVVMASLRSTIETIRDITPLLFILHQNGSSTPNRDNDDQSLISTPVTAMPLFTYFPLPHPLVSVYSNTDQAYLVARYFGCPLKGFDNSIDLEENRDMLQICELLSSLSVRLLNLLVCHCSDKASINSFVSFRGIELIRSALYQHCVLESFLRYAGYGSIGSLGTHSLQNTGMSLTQTVTRHRGKRHDIHSYESTSLYLLAQVVESPSALGLIIQNGLHIFIGEMLNKSLVISNVHHNFRAPELCLGAVTRIFSFLLPQLAVSGRSGRNVSPMGNLELSKVAAVLTDLVVCKYVDCVMWLVKRKIEHDAEQNENETLPASGQVLDLSTDDFIEVFVEWVEQWIEAEQNDFFSANSLQIPSIISFFDTRIEPPVEVNDDEESTALSFVLDAIQHSTSLSSKLVQRARKVANKTRDFVASLDSDDVSDFNGSFEPSSWSGIGMNDLICRRERTSVWELMWRDGNGDESSEESGSEALSSFYSSDHSTFTSSSHSSSSLSSRRSSTRGSSSSHPSSHHSSTSGRSPPHHRKKKNDPRRSLRHQDDTSDEDRSQSSSVETES